MDTELGAGRGPGGRPRTRCSGSEDEAQPGRHRGPGGCESAPRPSAPPSLAPRALGPWLPRLSGAPPRLSRQEQQEDLVPPLPRAGSVRCPLPAAGLAPPRPGPVSFPVCPQGRCYFPTLRISVRCPALQDEASSDHDGLNLQPVTSYEADETLRLFPHLWAGVPS